MYQKSLLSLLEYSGEELTKLVQLAHQLKVEKQNNIFPQRLRHKNIALIFEKPSTRTRCSFIVAAQHEGAHAECLTQQDIHLGAKESVEDTAQVLGRLFDGIMFRGFSQTTVIKLAQYAGVPVWNALTDLHHPTQALADIMTLQEKLGDLAGKKLVYLGDAANNVAHSLMLACAFFGMRCVLSGPQTRLPNGEILQQAQLLAQATGAEIILESNPHKAVRDAHCLYTDVWVSMGENYQAPEIQTRIDELQAYQINARLMQATANNNCIFLHCLPAIKGMEVTAEVFDSKYSCVFDQAENRMHTIKALMLSSLCK